MRSGETARGVFWSEMGAIMQREGGQDRAAPCPGAGAAGGEGGVRGL